MKYIKNIFLTLFLSIFLYSCATTMTPLEVNQTLPMLTKSKYLTAEETQNPNCKSLTRGKNYVAPQGLTVKDDLRNAAAGIDEWVTIDGGNAYKLINFRWITISTDKYGSPTSTQLVIDFDIYICK
ncbi:hypothetical protein SAMN05444143_103230 [Flavobacterium succinicans]|uniref:Lipoprotein n=1 Tax=Flavobacterium succinicans TaxID=29536 RepID=A0A1I4UMJ9_9FLAO|nr:hypothetical protein [Flavobacterium succinicans]SFM89970.1 hypothetical protein SAMN05444143_103230 [Flavobacterium succinicans]